MLNQQERNTSRTQLKSLCDSFVREIAQRITEDLEVVFGYPEAEWPAGNVSFDEVTRLNRKWVQDLESYLRKEGSLEEFVRRYSASGWTSFLIDEGALIFVEGEVVDIPRLRNNLVGIGKSQLSDWMKMVIDVNVVG